MVFGMWMGTLPVGALARRFGRRFALQTGSVFGILSGFVSYTAVLQGSFWLMVGGTFCGGLYAAAHQSYRFAAADTASEAFRPKAISWVLFGGVVAALVGAQLVIATQNLWPPYLFAATYLGQSALALISAGVLMFVNIPKPPPRSSTGQGRSLTEIAKQPVLSWRSPAGSFIACFSNLTAACGEWVSMKAASWATAHTTNRIFPSKLSPAM